MKYTLRQLEVFLAAAHFENITRAAESLAMSQSAASSALRDLERQFDVQLFDRVGKRFQINELGQLLRPRAHALLEQAKALENDLKQHKEAGSLKLGATMTIGDYLAVNLMAKYMEVTPNSRVTLEVGNTAQIVDQVANFALDIGLIEGELQHPDLEVRAWQEDELVVFCASDHPYAKRGEITDEELTAATWILRETGSGTRQAFERAMHGLLPELTVLMELQHSEAIKRAVEKNMGISCLSRISLEDAFERGSLVPLQVPHRDWCRHFYLIVHKHKYRSAGIEFWLDLCAD